MYLYQIFMFLQGHLHFFLYFVFTLVGQFFLDRRYLFMLKLCFIKPQGCIPSILIGAMVVFCRHSICCRRARAYCQLITITNWDSTPRSLVYSNSFLFLSLGESISISSHFSLSLFPFPCLRLFGLAFLVGWIGRKWMPFSLRLMRGNNISSLLYLFSRCKIGNFAVPSCKIKMVCYAYVVRWLALA